MNLTRGGSIFNMLELIMKLLEMLHLRQILVSTGSQPLCLVTVDSLSIEWGVKDHRENI